MTLLESYFQTIDNYAEKAKQKVGLADKDQIKKIDAKCEKTKNDIKELYEAMKKEEINLTKLIKNEMRL